VVHYSRSPKTRINMVLARIAAVANPDEHHEITDPHEYQAISKSGRSLSESPDLTMGDTGGIGVVHMPR
jgi:hypothetical protein